MPQTPRAPTRLSRVVVKLSGSLFPFPPNAALLKPFITYFRALSKKGVQPILVAGGGIAARTYIALARKFGQDEASLDEIGIWASRLNAGLLIAALGAAAFPTVPTTLDEAASATASGKIVVTGGLHPGHSTNATAALIAEKTRAQLFVNATDVDGVYTKDPRTDKAARKLKKIATGQLARLIARRPMGAGTYDLMDLVALKIIERSHLPTHVVQCTPNALQAVFNGKQPGTLIIPG